MKSPPERRDVSSRLLLPLLLVTGACASQPAQVRTDVADDDGAWAVEQLLSEAETALEEGDESTAQSRLTETEGRLPSLAGHPDRHQLTAQHATLQDWLRSGRLPDPPGLAAPARLVETEAPKDEEERVLYASLGSAPDKDSAVNSLETESDVATDALPVVAAPEENPAEEFRKGPVAALRQGLELAKKAKRTRKRRKRRSLYRKARARFSTCVEAAGELMTVFPELERKRFRAGGRKKMKGTKIRQRCKAKARWAGRRARR